VSTLMLIYSTNQYHTIIQAQLEYYDFRSTDVNMMFQADSRCSFKVTSIIISRILTRQACRVVLTAFRNTPHILMYHTSTHKNSNSSLW
jgi:RNase P/RNase MRP subunit p30